MSEKDASSKSRQSSVCTSESSDEQSIGSSNSNASNVPDVLITPPVQSYYAARQMDSSDSLAAIFPEWSGALPTISDIRILPHPSNICTTASYSDHSSSSSSPNDKNLVKSTSTSIVEDVIKQSGTSLQSKPGDGIPMMRVRSTVPPRLLTDFVTVVLPSTPASSSSASLAEGIVAQQQPIIDASGAVTKPQFLIGADDNDITTCMESDSFPQSDLFGDDDNDDICENRRIIIGICAMSKKSNSKPMAAILDRLDQFVYLETLIFDEEDILKKPVEDWPICNVFISFHSRGFPLDKAIEYVNLRQPIVVNDLEMQYVLQDRREVYKVLERDGIPQPRYTVLNRDGTLLDPSHIQENDDTVEINGVSFNKPFVEKPVSAEDHNVYIYFPTLAGGGSQRLFRKIGSRSSIYSNFSRVRKVGSFIYEEFMPTDGTDVKVYTVGPDYAHAEARKSPALDGKVERDKNGKEVRYPVMLSAKEKMIARKVCLAFKDSDAALDILNLDLPKPWDPYFTVIPFLMSKFGADQQTVCGFDLLRANGKSYVCDVNGFSFVKTSSKYYDDCAKVLGTMVMRALAPKLHIPWVLGAAPDDIPVVPTTSGTMMELRCIIAVMRHGDRTPKQKMKMEVKHPKFIALFEKHGGYKTGQLKLKHPKQLQEILDIARFLLQDNEQHPSAEIEEKKAKLEQLKLVLEMYEFTGIHRKIQLKYQQYGNPRPSSSDDDMPREPSLLLIVKWGGELTPAGKLQAEDLGKAFRTLYPGGQGEYGTPGLGILRLHSTYRHDLKIYASDEGRVQMTAAAFTKDNPRYTTCTYQHDLAIYASNEGRVQMTAAAFAKGFLALEGELPPILVQMVKCANTNGLLDSEGETSKYQQVVKERLNNILNQDRDFTPEEYQLLAPTSSTSLVSAMKFIKNPYRMCEKIHSMVKEIAARVRSLKMKYSPKVASDSTLYNGETWDLLLRRWGKLEKDFRLKNGRFDISKIPDVYDCIKYDLQHNQQTLCYDRAEELFASSKALADIVIPQEYGITKEEKLHIAQCYCTPLLRKIRCDLQQVIEVEETNDDEITRLDSRYSKGVATPERFVRTRLYFTSESHIHSLLTMCRYGGLLDNGQEKDEQSKKALDFISKTAELNYMTQIVVMMYEDPKKPMNTPERFHVELHFSPGAHNFSTAKELPGWPSNKFIFNHLETCQVPWSHMPKPIPRRKSSESRSKDSDEEKTPVKAIKVSKKRPGTKRADPDIPQWDFDDTDEETDDESSPVVEKKPTDVKEVSFIESGSSDSSVYVSAQSSLTSEAEKTEQETKNKTTEEPESPTASSKPITITKSSTQSNNGSKKEPSGRSQSFEEKRSQSFDDSTPEISYQYRRAPIIEKHYLTVQLPLAEYRNHRSFSSLFTLPGVMTSEPFKGLITPGQILLGSSSAPNLFSVVSGCCSDESLTMVPSIQPLETLHNSMTMHQWDGFLEQITTVRFQTPMSTPPIQLASPIGNYPCYIPTMSLAKVQNNMSSSSTNSSSDPSSPLSTSNSTPDDILNKLRLYALESDQIQIGTRLQVVEEAGLEFRPESSNTTVVAEDFATNSES